MMKKNILASTVLWFAITATPSLYAQQHADRTLGSLWPKVEKDYPGVAAKMAKIDAIKFQEQAIRSRALPQVNLQAQNTYGTFLGSPGAFFPQPGFFNVSGSVPQVNGSSTAANTFASATVEWELYQFGKIRDEHQAAATRHERTVEERDAYLLELKKVLSERYIQLLYSEAKLNWTDKNVQRLDSIQTITAGLSAAGLRPAADSLLASSSLEQAKGEREKWVGSQQASCHRLQELYGDGQIDYQASSARFIDPRPLTRASREGSMRAHPALKALDKQAEYFTVSAKAARKSALPALRLLGGYAARGSGIQANGHASAAWKDGFSHGTSNFLAGIGLTWNLTRLHTAGLKSAELRKEAERTQHLHTRYMQARQAEFAASRSNVQQHYRQLEKTRLAVEQSKAAYTMYFARYKSGLIALTELLQIRTLLEQAENAHIRAARDYWLLLAIEAELAADFQFLFTNL
ncbi:MAG: TolC family protein [Sphingobacterium sp.]